MDEKNITLLSIIFLCLDDVCKEKKKRERLCMEMKIHNHSFIYLMYARKRRKKRERLCIMRGEGKVNRKLEKL
jgi:hypothetical protein